jgi:HEAT repeat protein
MVGKYDQGLAYLRESFAMNTADPDVRYHIGYALAKLNRPVEAKRELQNLLENFSSFERREDTEALLRSL